LGAVGVVIVKAYCADGRRCAGTGVALTVMSASTGALAA